MNTICLLAGALSAVIPSPTFTLQWSHSVEHILWQEDWRLEGDRLSLVEARIRGSGAGMDPPEGAVLRDGVWHYHAERHIERLLLSSGTGQPEYLLCADGHCRALTDWLGGPAAQGSVELAPCPPK